MEIGAQGRQRFPSARGGIAGDAGLNLSRVLESQEDFPSSALPRQHGNATKHPADVREEGKTGSLSSSSSWVIVRRGEGARRGGQEPSLLAGTAQGTQSLGSLAPLPHVWGV